MGITQKPLRVVQEARKGVRGCGLGEQGMQLGDCESCRVYVKATGEIHEEETAMVAWPPRDMHQNSKAREVLLAVGSGRPASQGLF